MDDILTTILVIGVIIILLQVMILISYWRRGTKYAAMEKVYRERQAEVNARESNHTKHVLADWDVDEEEDELIKDHEDPPSDLDPQAALDDPPRT